MKRIVLAVVGLSCLVLVSKAQTSVSKAQASATCYDEYATLFRQRGGKPVPDGTHKVVIGIRPHQGPQQCFIGKIDVKNGEFVPPLYVQKDDGSFEPMQGEMDAATERIPVSEKRKITDASSFTLVTVDGDFVRVFLTDFLADKPKANKTAPSAKSY